MTKDEFEILLTDKPNDVKARGAVLYNAVGVTMSDYNKERSVANLRNMEAAKDAFDKFIAEIGGGKTGESFNNEAAVLKYLKEAGWRISKSTLNRHIKTDRKLIRQSDGTFTIKAVERYAEAFLKQEATGKRVQENTDDLQRQKLEQELKNLRLKNERDTFSYDKDRGLYVPKEQMEIELATRAGILIAGLKHWIVSNTAEWINLVGGDTRKAGELITKMSNDLDEHINHYAGSREYEVIIESEAQIQ